MRDFHRLRRHLATAIFFAGTATAMADGPPGPPGPPSHPPLPSCPSGEFCAPAKTMKKYADKKSPVKLACPTAIKSEEHDRKDTPTGMPAMNAARFTFDEAETKAKQDAGDKTTCCYDWVIMCPGGRPLLDEDTPTTAPVQRGSSWAGARLRRKPDARLARVWLDDARLEHASVAAFARATIELMAVGAPADLIAAHQRAALDEIEHARLCFALGSAYAGEPVEPGPLPALAPRAPDLERLARDTFVEGCVGETISALAAARAARGAERGVWRRLATDEADHAALAWRTLAWLVSRGAGRGLHAIAAEMQARSAKPSRRRALPGRLSDAALAEVRADAFRHVILPTLASLVPA